MPPFAGFDLERYAALCVECTLYPDWLGQIRTRYGLRSERDHAALDQHYRTCIGGNPDFAASFHHHYRIHEQRVRARY